MTTFRQGDIIKRGDTGTLAMVLSNELVHRNSRWVMLCSVNRTEHAAQAHPATVPVGEHYVLPIKMQTVPDSAIAETVGKVTPEQLQQVIRINHAATSTG